MTVQIQLLRIVFVMTSPDGCLEIAPPESSWKQGFCLPVPKDTTAQGMQYMTPLPRGLLQTMWPVGEKKIELQPAPFFVGSLGAAPFSCDMIQATMRRWPASPPA